MSIPETPSKIKSLVILGLKTGSFILILGIAFILGRISVLATLKQADPIEIIYQPLVKTSIPQYNQAGNTTAPENWSFAGSKTGKTYYPKGCSGLSRIKPENRVYFTTATEATSAGYHPSTACN